jgi:hypothetical protein
MFWLPARYRPSGEVQLAQVPQPTAQSNLGVKRFCSVPLRKGMSEKNSKPTFFHRRPVAASVGLYEKSAFAQPSTTAEGGGQSRGMRWHLTFADRPCADHAPTHRPNMFPTQLAQNLAYPTNFHLQHASSVAA